jgi:hypothetical protein
VEAGPSCQEQQARGKVDALGWGQADATDRGQAVLHWQGLAPAACVARG